MYIYNIFLIQSPVLGLGHKILMLGTKIVEIRMKGRFYIFLCIPLFSMDIVYVGGMVWALV
jgi:hypothetical protein